MTKDDYRKVAAYARKKAKDRNYTKEQKQRCLEIAENMERKAKGETT